MKITAQTFHFEKLEYDIEYIYTRLNLSSQGIVKLIQEELNQKGLYNPKRDILPNGDHPEFESFQEIMRNLNNIVYYNSLLLGAYSVFEICLIGICEFIGSHSMPRKEFVRPNREILKKSRRFINDTKLIDLSNKEIYSIYNHLSNVNKFRNLIAHYNGNLITEKNKSIEQQIDYEYCKNEKFLTIMDTGQVYINDSEYINKFIRYSEKFVKSIVEQIKNCC